jgi:hypothetical protein
VSVKVPRFRHVDGRGLVRKRLDRRLRVPVITARSTVPLKIILELRGGRAAITAAAHVGQSVSKRSSERVPSFGNDTHAPAHARDGRASATGRSRARNHIPREPLSNLRLRSSQ